MKPWTCSFIAIFLVALSPAACPGIARHHPGKDRRSERLGDCRREGRGHQHRHRRSLHLDQQRDRRLTSCHSLIPGDYEMVVESRGFRTSKRPGIAVRESDRVTIDTTMQLRRSVAEACRCRPSPPSLDTSTASLGIVVEPAGRSATCLSKDGMVLILATLTPRRDVHPADCRLCATVRYEARPRPCQ